MKVSFQIKLFISLVAFFSVLFALLGGYYYADVGKQLYQEMSARAKIQAEEIALRKVRISRSFLPKLTR
ncbi:hypothetical protein NQ116_19640 [Enterobacter kobei]|nr:hypothetical protein [Enterobacter kobei]MCR2777142.1 hypothetical protein [Enterobacter kobei]